MGVSLSDALDRADVEIQRTIDMGIANARANLAGSRRLPPKGYCYNCDEPFPGDNEKIFCDSDCRDDYERINENRRYK
jgi:hypothetical protein